MTVAFSNTQTITVSVVGLFVVIGLFVLLRVIFRSEPSPPSWRRLRAGFFVERDPNHKHDKPEDEQ